MVTPPCGDPNCGDSCELGKQESRSTLRRKAAQKGEEPPEFAVPEAWKNVDTPGEPGEYRVVRVKVDERTYFSDGEVVEVKAAGLTLEQAIELASPGDPEYPVFDLDIEQMGWRRVSWEPVVVQS